MFAVAFKNTSTTDPVSLVAITTPATASASVPASGLYIAAVGSSQESLIALRNRLRTMIAQMGGADQDTAVLIVNTIIPVSAGMVLATTGSLFSVPSDPA